MNHPLLQKYPSGSIPVLELSKAIGQEATNVRRKAASLNGQVNFNPDEDTLNVEQLKALLPTYLQGQRQLKGNKRKSVEALLKSLGESVEITVHPPVKEVKEAPPKVNQTAINQRQKSRTEQVVNFLFGWLEETYTLRPFAFIAALTLIFWQAGHFANLEALESPGNGTFDWLSSWGIALGFESLVMLITMNSNKQDWRTWLWLIGFAVIATFVNLCFYQVIEWRIWRKVVLSVALPFSILAMTHLYLTKTKKA